MAEEELEVEDSGVVDEEDEVQLLFCNVGTQTDEMEAELEAASRYAATMPTLPVRSWGPNEIIELIKSLQEDQQNS